MYKNCIKRCLDFVLAILLLIVTSPILLIAMLVLVFENKGNVIFKQKRVGKNQKVFYIYKLRTMAIDEKDGINKVTKIGHFLRSTSIDELPQLINIIKGEMSFIGPRPWIEDYHKYFTKKDKRRLEVLPGISGWAQVCGRNDLSVKEKIKQDIWYVDNISFLVDLKIVFKTIGIVLKKTGVSISEKGIQEEIEELRDMYSDELLSKKKIV